MLTKLARLLRRARGKKSPEDSTEKLDRLERNQLSAQYTGSFAKDPPDRYGIKPPK
jgi:hypothetical protein